jgi:hypothetical protein
VSKAHSCLILTEKLEGFLTALKANGCVVWRDTAAGVVEARDGRAPVLKAIQTGRGQPWIARFIDTDRIQWSPPQ